jgi:hypothetical protein
MSKPLSERLSQFTPDGSSIDRDALLFAAGRASARPNRGWIVVVGALAACQVLTLAVLLPRTISPIERPNSLAIRNDLEEVAPAAPPDASELGALTRQFLAGKDSDVASPGAVANLVPSDPPLTSLSASTLAEMR